MRNGVRPASSCVANVIYPVVAADAHRPELQRVERLPAAPGVRRGGRLPPRPRGRVAQLRRQRPVHPGARHTAARSPTRSQPGLFGQALDRRQPSPGAQPATPPGGQRPPLQPNVPCETQPPITDPVGADRAGPQQVAAGVDARPRPRCGRSSAGLLWLAAAACSRPKQQGFGIRVSQQGPEERPTMKRAIKTHAVDFAAIIVLLVLSIVVAGLHPQPRAPALPVHRVLAVHAQRRVLDRAGGDARAGPDGARLRRPDRRDRRGHAEERDRGRADATSTSSTST